MVKVKLEERNSETPETDVEDQIKTEAQTAFKKMTAKKQAAYTAAWQQTEDRIISDASRNAKVFEVYHLVTEARRRFLAALVGGKSPAECAELS